MWVRFTHSRGIEFLRVDFDFGTKVGIANGVGHHKIDASAKIGFEIFLESEIGIERILDAALEFDKKVNVASPRIETIGQC